MSTSRAPGADPVAGWRDPKKPWWVLGTVMPLLPVLSWGLVSLTGSPLAWFFAPFFVFVLVPLVDLLVGLDPSTPPDEVIAALEEDRYYRWVTYAFLPLQYAVLLWSTWLLGHGDLAVRDKVGLAVGVGIVGGVAINIAHELGHKTMRHERWLARIALAQPAYGHFFIEHNRGHHVRVATHQDPASARFGESVWHVLPRTVAGGLRSAWGLEARRLRRRGLRVWGLSNDILGAWADARHSWNSNNIGTNVLLYHLQRHSDHHANPTRRYQSLRDHPTAPVLPTGYAGMIVLSWVPALWRHVMDPRVLTHVGGDLSRVNRTGAAVQQDPSGRAEHPDAVAVPTSRVACPACGWVYDEARGAPREGWPAGTPAASIDPDWPCPDCGVRERRDFVPTGGGG